MRHHLSKSSILKFISWGGVGSLDLDRRPWPDRPTDELRNDRLGRCPCSSSLTDREWAVLLSVFTERGRFRKSLAALDWLSRGLLEGLVLSGGGGCWGVMGLAAPLPPLPGRSRVPSDLDSSDSSLRSDATTPSSASSYSLRPAPRGAYPDSWSWVWSWVWSPFPCPGCSSLSLVPGWCPQIPSPCLCTSSV